MYQVNNIWYRVQEDHSRHLCLTADFSGHRWQAWKPYGGGDDALDFSVVVKKTAWHCSVKPFECSPICAFWYFCRMTVGGGRRGLGLAESAISVCPRRSHPYGFSRVQRAVLTGRLHAANLVFLVYKATHFEGIAREDYKSFSPCVCQSEIHLRRLPHTGDTTSHTLGCEMFWDGRLLQQFQSPAPVE